MVNADLLPRPPSRLGNDRAIFDPGRQGLLHHHMTAKFQSEKYQIRVAIRRGQHVDHVKSLFTHFFQRGPVERHPELHCFFLRSAPVLVAYPNNLGKRNALQRTEVELADVSSTDNTYANIMILCSAHGDCSRGGRPKSS